MSDFRTLLHAITKADYDRLEAEGKITRPLTQGPVKPHVAPMQTKEN